MDPKAITPGTLKQVDFPAAPADVAARLAALEQRVERLELESEWLPAGLDDADFDMTSEANDALCADLCEQVAAIERGEEKGIPVDELFAELAREADEYDRQRRESRA